MREVKVLVFDTGGTILDWHGGLVAVLADRGSRRGVERDWHSFANEYRRRALGRMLGAVDPDHNIDDVHCDVLGELLAEELMDAVSPEDRRVISSAGTNLTLGPISCRRWRVCEHGTFAWPSRS